MKTESGGPADTLTTLIRNFMTGRHRAARTVFDANASFRLNSLELPLLVGPAGYDAVAQWLEGHLEIARVTPTAAAEQNSHVATTHGVAHVRARASGLELDVPFRLEVDVHDQITDIYLTVDMLDAVMAATGAPPSTTH